MYETYLKQKLIEFSKDYPKEVQDVFNTFKEEDKKGEEKKQPKIIQFIKESKRKDMFPMLMFHTNEDMIHS